MASSSSFQRQRSRLVSSRRRTVVAVASFLLLVVLVAVVVLPKNASSFSTTKAPACTVGSRSTTTSAAAFFVPPKRQQRLASCCSSSSRLRLSAVGGDDVKDASSDDDDDGISGSRRIRNEQRERQRVFIQNRRSVPEYSDVLSEEAVLAAAAEATVAAEEAPADDDYNEDKEEEDDDDDHGTVASCSGPEEGTYEVAVPPPVATCETAFVGGKASSSSSSSSSFAAFVPSSSSSSSSRQTQTTPTLRIRIGNDWTKARKAWKKRRRSGSPLLVPCSVLSADRSDVVRHNLGYLLEKFGQSGSSSTGNNNNNKGIRISVSELSRRYQSHLRSSLSKQAAAMGYETTERLVEAMFSPTSADGNEAAGGGYGGIQLVETGQHRRSGDGEADSSTSTLWLQAPISRMRAQTRANKAAVLQFVEREREDGATGEDGSLLVHTGIVRTRRPKDGSSGDGNNSNNGSLYQLQPLSAALRINKKEDLESYSRILQKDSVVPAAVFDFDPTGDAGSPLLTLSLIPPSSSQSQSSLGGGGDIQEFKKKVAAVVANEPLPNPKRILDDLTVGDGPMYGKVVRLVKGGALIDCRVGRKLAGKKDDPADDDDRDDEIVKVLGVLDFADAVTSSIEESFQTRRRRGGTKKQQKPQPEEEDQDLPESSYDELFAKLNSNEREEDLTHLFNLDDDGSLSYHDPETGETEILSMDDDIDAADEAEEERRRVERKLSDAISRSDVDGDESVDWDEKPQQQTRQRRRYRSHRVRVGERIPVYVKSVSKQSSRLVLTMDALAVQGRTAKELKQEASLSKKLSRLEKQICDQFPAGTDLRAAVKQLSGREWDGVVQATSQTGDWLYVQPEGTDEYRLPVGVASVSPDDANEDGSSGALLKGDKVRIKISGVDENRGQLSMRVLRKVAP